MNLRTTKGLTLPELLIVLGVLAIILLMIMPAFRPRPRPAPRISCMNNLKQVGLAFRTWSIDHADQFPMGVSTNAGGTMQFVNGPNAFAHFQLMSNELSTPKVLLCPADSKREWATNFANFRNAHLSYFVAVDAITTNEHWLLCGDRNVTNGLAVKNGLLELPTNRLAGWTRELHKNCGNVGFADGSVRMMQTKQLTEAVAGTGMATNRLAMP